MLCSSGLCMYYRMDIDKLEGSTKKDQPIGSGGGKGMDPICWSALTDNKLTKTVKRTLIQCSALTQTIKSPN